MGPNMGPKIKIATRKRLDTRPKSVVTMSPTQADQSEAVGTKYGPSGPSEDLQDPHKGHLGPKRALLGPLGARKKAQYQAKVCGNHDSNPVGPICSNWDQIWPQVWPPELLSQLGPVLGQKGPLGPPVSTYKAPEWANMTYNYVSDPWVVF